MALHGATAPAHRRNAVKHNLRMLAPMNDSPSDEDVGRQILSVFMRNRVPVSGMLPRNFFSPVRDGDFQRGLNRAVANDWIAIARRNRYRYQLTATGHSTGRTLEAPVV